MAFTMPDTRTYTADNDYSPCKVVFADSGAQAFVQALRSRAMMDLWGGINQQETVAGLSGHSLLTLFPLLREAQRRTGASL